MGQIGIPMLNKVGYSMFWNSMWDNKINYSRNLKEDIYLNKIFKYLLNDNTSFNTLTHTKKREKMFNYKLSKSKHFYKKNLFKLNKIIFYSSKLWILKYQKWVILYNFIYIPKFSEISKFNIKKGNLNKNSIFFKNLYKIHMKANSKLKASYSFFKKKVYNF